MWRASSFHGALLVAAASVIGGCASPGAAVPVRAAAVPARAEAPPRVTITEPDATVSTSLAPLVEAAGPATLFVPESSVRCPGDMALVADRVCVDRWEASIVRVVDRKEVAWSPYAVLDGVAGFRAVSRAGVVPQGYVSGRQAEQACRASGKRLCTATEWEAGCRGSRRTQFPYGDDRRERVCNDDVRDKHPVIEAALREGVAQDRLWTDGMNLPLVNQLEGGLAETGAREGCVTPEGLYDMVGNLHEWVADADGTFRGGYYMDTSRNGDGCSYQTTAHDFDYHDYSTGFRCCADPEPVE